jgi:hypothetical protein
MENKNNNNNKAAKTQVCLSFYLDDIMKISLGGAS